MAYTQYSIIPYFIISATLLIVAAFILQVSQFYRSTCIELSKSHFESIDGLRGYLALSVFYHHAVINQHYFQTWVWEANGGAFYPTAAHFGVATFFMITGFLFWNKVIKSEGKINIQNFYISRIKRLVPAYSVSIAMVIFLAFASRNFQLWEQFNVLISKILSWFAFGLLGSPNLNKVPGTGTINAGVIWTLAYEWKFYLALPLISIAWRGYPFLIMFTLMCIYSFFVEDARLIELFAYGIATAYLLNKFDLKSVFCRNYFSLIAVLLLVSVFLIPRSYQHFLFFLFFIIVAGGNSVFGLFSNAPAKLLGTISYSVYLFHGIVLFVVMHGLNQFLSIAELNETNFWLVTMACGLLTVTLACITYRFIEHPFLHK